MVAGTGLRFIVDVEAGKPTCQLAKVLQVLEALGGECAGALSILPQGMRPSSNG